MHADFWRQLGLIASFEWLRLFHTKRGWLSLGTLVVIWYFIIRYLVLQTSDYLQQDIGMYLAGLGAEFGLQGMDQWQVPELSLFWILGLMIFPVFAMLMSADQTSTDRARGSLRFLSLHTTRERIVLGRALGHALMQIALVVTALLAVWLSSTLQDNTKLIPSLPMLPVLVLNLSVFVLPYIAMMCFFSSITQSARSALLLAFLWLVIMSAVLGYLESSFPFVLGIRNLIPGTQFYNLVITPGWESPQQLVLPLVQTLGFMSLAIISIKRSAL